MCRSRSLTGRMRAGTPCEAVSTREASPRVLLNPKYVRSLAAISSPQCRSAQLMEGSGLPRTLVVSSVRGPVPATVGVEVVDLEPLVRAGAVLDQSAGVEGITRAQGRGVLADQHQLVVGADVAEVPPSDPPGGDLHPEQIPSVHS